MKSRQLLENLLSPRCECLQDLDEAAKREHGCAGCLNPVEHLDGYLQGLRALYMKSQ